ncbi:MAG: hypothetical protein KKA28_06390 [Planctomycetes bacterium]|nr:hypothetical protein [Planctomycetota bacterium]MCG2683114.1 hypothetical protein [Planctomycetales bacterium]
MSKSEANNKLLKVKLALAEKCDRLIQTMTSVPKRKKLTNQAARFRRQAADLARR